MQVWNFSGLSHVVPDSPPSGLRLLLEAADVPAVGGGESVALHQVADDDGGGPDVGVGLPGLGQVGDAGVGAHEDVGGVQAALHEPSLRLREVDAAEGRLGQVVVRHQRDAVEADLVIKYRKSITNKHRRWLS